MAINVFKRFVTMNLKPRKNCLAGESTISKVSLPGLTIVYSLIDDDNFIHALRVYRDRMSGAIRLQASVHEGDMRRYVIAKPIDILRSKRSQGHPCGQPL